MNARTLSITVIAMFLPFVGDLGAEAADPNRDAKATRDAAQDKKVRELIARVVAKQQLPGMIAAIASSDGVTGMAATGIRKTGSPEQLTDQDLFHVGSCTKAMTSAMLATLVAEGKLTWETTLIEVFPELKDVAHQDYHRATLWMFLTHRAGVPANAENWWVHRKLEIKARRLAILRRNLAAAPAVRPGKYLYSNLGYLVAGCMAERRTGKSWESLMKQRLFRPLGMTSAGFGPPGTSGKADQPWGHVKSEGKWQPKHFDNAEALGPAGRVHCSLEDWARFAALQLPRAKPRILRRKMLDKLIEPAGEYAAGWLVVQRPWAKGTALTHSGSNTMWYATIWVAPNVDRAFLAVTNSRDDKSPAICDQVISALIAIDRESRRE